MPRAPNLVAESSLLDNEIWFGDGHSIDRRSGPKSIREFPEDRRAEQEFELSAGIVDAEVHLLMFKQEEPCKTKAAIPVHPQGAEVKFIQYREAGLRYVDSAVLLIVMEGDMPRERLDALLFFDRPASSFLFFAPSSLIGNLPPARVDDGLVANKFGGGFAEKTRGGLLGSGGS